MRLRWLLLAIMLAGPLQGGAAEVAGVVLADTLQPGVDAPLLLNGAGVRKRAFFQVYAMGLYLPARTSSAAEVLALAGPKRVAIHMLRDVDAGQFTEALADGIRQNHGEAGAKALESRVQELAAIMAGMKDARKGMAIALDWVPQSGTRVLIDGKPAGKAIAGEDFYRGLLRIWLGDDPVQADLKRALLGSPSRPMPHYDFTAPVTEQQVRALRIDDSVTLHGTLYGIRDATQIHMFDRGRSTRFDLRGHAVIHTAPNVRKVERSAAHPAGYAPVCIGTTTSERMERFTRPLMQQCGVRIVIGKGGLRAGSAAAFAELGGVYLAIVGGTAALETTWVEAIEDVDLDDLNPESLWKFRVRDFGPLLVAMDSAHGSLYDQVRESAQARRAEALARLGVK